MKRTVYESDRERKTDQLLGAIAFPIVNTCLGFITNQLLEWAQRVYGRSPAYSSVHTRILLLPWLVNGVILTMAFLFRPHIGVGYITFPLIVLGAAMVLSVVFLAGCFAGLVVGISVSDALGYLVFCVLFLLGAGLLLKGAIAVFRDWWSSPPSGPEENSAGEVEAARGDEDKGKQDQRQSGRI